MSRIPTGAGQGRGARTPNMAPSVGFPDLPGAACRGMDPDLWSEADTDRAGRRPEVDPESIRAAKAVCASCTERIACGTWAIEHDELGIWGGMTRHERDAIWDQIRSVA